LEGGDPVEPTMTLSRIYQYLPSGQYDVYFEGIDIDGVSIKTSISITITPTPNEWFLVTNPNDDEFKLKGDSSVSLQYTSFGFTPETITLSHGINDNDLFSLTLSGDTIELQRIDRYLSPNSYILCFSTQDSNGNLQNSYITIKVINDVPDNKFFAIDDNGIV
jgi:hypothetical protein